MVESDVDMLLGTGNRGRELKGLSGILRDSGCTCTAGKRGSREYSYTPFSQIEKSSQWGKGGVA